MGSSFELQKINKQIESVLSGDGDFDALRALESEKKDILDREHFRHIEGIKSEISALENEQAASRQTVAELEIDRQLLAAQMNKLSLEMENLQERYSDANGRIYLANSALDLNRKAINAKKSELALIIDKKINPQNYDADGNLKITEQI